MERELSKAVQITTALLITGGVITVVAECENSNTAAEAADHNKIVQQVPLSYSPRAFNEWLLTPVITESDIRSVQALTTSTPTPDRTIIAALAATQTATVQNGQTMAANQATASARQDTATAVAALTMRPVNEARLHGELDRIDNSRRWGNSTTNTGTTLIDWVPTAVVVGSALFVAAWVARRVEHWGHHH